MVPKLGVIGGGVMGEAILSRLLAQGRYGPESVLVSEPGAERRRALEAQYGVRVTADNAAAAQAGVLLLAIKPQVFGAVAAQLGAELDAPQRSHLSNQLVVSILAGTSLQTLQLAFAQQPIIRAMPNTPALVGAGCTAIAPGPYAQPEHLETARQLFGAIGSVVEVPESLMDAVTGLSGSGPAYVALMVEALADGGVLAGLPRAIAQKLALETVLGTAELLKQTGQHPAQLKDQVTSPGGTTIAGVSALEQGGFRAAVMNAVRAAWQRSRELGQSPGDRSKKQ
ncbi:MAG: pyrroline-5-carboxylate reductase [Synechococcales cyanobacterium RM1_1_8]|nr:pyrroline-5-carboxylate reductase [Synechococcales cyanobacterium RM1_1_8]